MSATAVPSPGEILKACSQQQATVDQVFRCLVSHRRWIVPTLLMQQYYGRDSFDTIELYSTEYRYRDKVLWLFTDHGEVIRAQAAGALLGPCASGIRGTELFANVSPHLEGIMVNPGSPLELTWCIVKDNFPIAQAWAEAILFEEAMEKWRAPGVGVDWEVFGVYRGFLAFTHPNDSIVTLPNREGLSNAAAVFTAPDCAQAFLDRFTEEQRAGLKKVFTDGRELSEKLPQQGVDGMIVNAFGPGPMLAVAFREA